MTSEDIKHQLIIGTSTAQDGYLDLRAAPELSVFGGIYAPRNLFYS